MYLLLIKNKLVKFPIQKVRWGNRKCKLDKPYIRYNAKINEVFELLEYKFIIDRKWNMNYEHCS